MSPFTSTPSAAGGQRTPVEFDQRTGDLRIGPYERRVADPAQPEQVFGAYLSLLYAVRGAKPGDKLPLRAADLEALLLIVGDDPATIESRLVDLMGCTPAEAGVLSRLLLKQRRATATLGIAAGLSLAGVGLVTQLTGGEQAAAPVQVEQSSTTTTTSAPLESVVAAPVAPAAPALVGPAVITPLVGEVFQAAPAAPAPAVVGPQAPPAPAPALAPVTVAAPAAEAPVADAPVAAAPVVVEVAPEDRYEMPLAEAPVMDAPPPMDVPESGIGEAVSLEPGVLAPISGIGGSEEHVPAPVEQISGVTDSGHGAPVEVPEAVEPAAPVAADAEPPVDQPTS